MPTLIPLPTESIATHRKVRWPQLTIYNGETYESCCIQAQAVTVPVRLDGEEVVRVEGMQELLSGRQILIRYDEADPRHQQLYALLDELVKEADAKALAQPPMTIPPVVPAPPILPVPEPAAPEA